MKKASKNFEKEFREASRLTGHDTDPKSGVTFHGKIRVQSVFTPGAIRMLRVKKMKQSQSQFARMFQVKVNTLQEWEQGRRKPSGPAQALLKIIAGAPETAERILAR